MTPSSSSELSVLVDYNNVASADRTRGLVYLCDRVIDTLDPAFLIGFSRIRFRLYDGWYISNSPTRLAQQVQADIRANVPHSRTITSGSESSPLLINVEMAYGLSTMPSHHLIHTFRPRHNQADIQCNHPTSAGCTSAYCPLDDMHAFLSTRRCRTASCTVVPSDIITRNEQKLVDTMIACDMFALHKLASSEVVVVSSDDDMWPAIQTVLHFGMTVFHVHTKPGRSTPHYYCRVAGRSYSQHNL